MQRVESRILPILILGRISLNRVSMLVSAAVGLLVRSSSGTGVDISLSTDCAGGSKWARASSTGIAPNSSFVVRGSDADGRTSRCLNVADWGTTAGAHVWTTICTTGEVPHSKEQNRVWLLQPNGTLLNPASGLCFDGGAGDASAPGARLQLRDCGAKDASTWSFDSVSGQLASPRSGLCVALDGGGSPTPAPVPTPPGHINRACSDAASRALPFCNASLSLEARVNDLVGRLQPDEAGPLLTARHAAPVGRLGIPAYDWGVNSIHGDQVSCGSVACATNFPLPMAVGATFNSSLVAALGSMMAKELRALRLEGACEHHRRRLRAAGVPHSLSEGKDACIGLDTWAPNININRDPRWGRNWEVASEDPYHSGEVGAAYAAGFQRGDADAADSRFLKGVLTLKHWAAYNVEANRGGYDAQVPAFDLAGTFLPAFRRAVRKGGAAGMSESAGNRLRRAD